MDMHIPPTRDQNVQRTQAERPTEAWTRALTRTAPFARGEGAPLPALVADMAARFAARPALLAAEDSLTYGELAARIAGYARWALDQELRAGEAVGLLLPNSPDYVAIWLGITSVRGVAALLNTNLAGDALLHALATASVRHVIVGAEGAAALAEIAARLPAGVRTWGHGEGAPWPRIDRPAGDWPGPKPGAGPAPAPEVAAAPASAPGAGEGRQAVLTDLALMIYTSGTTGLPKAAHVSHRRIAEWSCWFAGMIDTRPDDRMYNCLPMYHSTGGVVAVGAMLVAGASVLIRPRFSASRFWDDIVEHDCTLFQYIGELCRYLADSPPHPRETAHRLRLCCGNGLRGDIWTRFQERFDIPRILEFYASTEGNVSLYNCPGRPGAIGHVPGFLAHRFPIALVRCDPQTRALLRDAAGLCVPCGPDEAGEALGRIGGPDSAGRPFEGYADRAASAAKVARDVLAPGDAWFRTGDLMRRDREGFYYFVDRLGDTFRWKGENVATEEVAAALRACAGVTDAVVYGVAVPGTEGRAGMAALTVAAEFDLAAFRGESAARLPDYARPVFLRVTGRIAATGTFKPATGALADEGFDPDRVAGDALYVDDRARAAFVPLDGALHARILRGEFRL
jgi:fatty-acyl-CoA synthase